MQPGHHVQRIVFHVESIPQQILIGDPTAYCHIQHDTCVARSGVRPPNLPAERFLAQHMTLVVGGRPGRNVAYYLIEFHCVVILGSAA